MSSELKPRVFLERTDREDGSISYEIWSHVPYRCICSINDLFHDNAKANAEFLVEAWNSRATTQHPAVEAIESFTINRGEELVEVEGEMRFIKESDFKKYKTSLALTSQTPAETSETKSESRPELTGQEHGRQTDVVSESKSPSGCDGLSDTQAETSEKP